MFKDYDELMREAKKYGSMCVSVAGGQEDAVVSALKTASEHGLITAKIFGIKDKILELSETCGYKVNPDEIVDIADPDLCAAAAVKEVSEGRADLLMKGSLRTDTVMRAVFNKEYGLRKGGVISHLFMIKLPGYDKFLSLTDGGINIAPELPDQLSIIKNAANFYHLMGMEAPKVAVLAPTETVSDKIPSTMNAALLAKMWERGQIPGVILDGPLGFDNAISMRSVKEKGIVSPVAGDADILFVSDIDMGNSMFKALIYFGQGVPAAVVLGASAPIIITSRADSAECKLYSIALNILYAAKLRKLA